MKTFQDTLQTIENSDFYPFHMPGHKRIPINDHLNHPYKRDITEITDFDNLHHPEGFIFEEQKYVAKEFGAEDSFYLVNGSTCGILASIMTVSQKEKKILVARNSHVALYNALYLSGANADYLYPMHDKKYPFSGSISTKDIKNHLKCNKYSAIFITSPTYEGILSDIGSICEIAHSYDIPVIVDEAHGAYLSIFGNDGFFPGSAIQQGADIVIQSTHKTLPSMTQTALLHVQGNLINRNYLKYHLSVFQSSSPSYILMESISDGIHYCIENREQFSTRYREQLKRIYDELSNLKNLHLLSNADCDSSIFFQKDPGKLVLVINDDVSFTGKELLDLLHTKYHLEMEMAESSYIIAMTSIMDTDEGLQRFCQAILEIDQMLSEKPKKSVVKKDDSVSRYIHNETVVSIKDAFQMEKEELRLENAIGKSSAEFIYLYPPGIPVLVPGEKITQELVVYLEEKISAGLSVQGAGQIDKKIINCLK